MTTKLPHILLIRLSAMGDAAMVSPVVRSLREANPDLKITVLTRPFFRPFFRDIPEVEFFTPDFKGRHKGLPGIYRLYKDMSGLGITHVADLHDVLRTKILRNFFRSCGTKVSVIDKGRAAKKALTRKFRKFMVQLRPTVERYREAVVALGFDVPEPQPPGRVHLDIPGAISEVSGDKTGKWIGVAPFAQHKGKIYPTILMVELLSILAQEYEKVFIFGGGPYEEEFGRCMEERFPNVISVMGRIKLDKELDLISNLDCMLSMDSSAMHMASLVGTPVVSVWGATHPFAGFYGFGQDPENAVQLELTCRPCSVYGNKPCMYRDYRCLKMIPPEMIAARIRKVMKAE